MKVVLLYPAWTGEYGLFGHFAKRNSTWPPLNLAVLAAVCEQAGHETVILDGEAMRWKKERLAQEACALKPDIVGLTAYSPFFHLSADVASEIKKINPDIPVMVGGPHITIQKEKALLSQFEYGFMGEAEKSLPEFLDIFSGSRDFGKMRGILFRCGKEIVNTGAAWLRDATMRKSELGGKYPLDEIPLPARHLLPMEKYKLGTPNGRDHFTSIQTARGCPWTCLVAGTQILMADGRKIPIEKIRKGDKIACADIRNERLAIGTIIHASKRLADDIYRVSFSDGTAIDITSDHPVWTRRKWIRVKKLKVGDEVFALPDLWKNDLKQISKPYSTKLFARMSERNANSIASCKETSAPSLCSMQESYPGKAQENLLLDLSSEFTQRKSNVATEFKSQPKTTWSGNFQDDEGASCGRTGSTSGMVGSGTETGQSLYDSKQPDEAIKSCSKTRIDYGKAASRRKAIYQRQKVEQVRNAVGQDFESMENVGKAHRQSQLLDRSRPIGETALPGFYSFGENQKGNPVQRKILAYRPKYRREQDRLSQFRMGSSASMGGMFEEGTSINVKNGRRAVFDGWVKVTDIALLGTDMVYPIAVEPWKNFFAGDNPKLLHNCIFCASDALKTTRYLMKSPKRVVEEMVDVAERFPFIKHLFIVDDVLTFWPEHIIEICDRMDAEGLEFTFESSTRANLVSDKLIERLAKSGLIRLSFGLETIDPVMRVTMQKKVPIEAYAVANRICSKHGVEAMNSLMIGLPGETKETIQHTLEWVASQRDIKQANLAIAIPYPGTEFHEMAVSGNYGVELLSEDFGQYLRYGNAVTNVGDMTAQDLIDKQNEGFVMIYSKWWRWLPVWHKHGTLGFLLQMYRVFKLWKKRFLKWSPFQPIMRHPKET